LIIGRACSKVKSSLWISWSVRSRGVTGVENPQHRALSHSGSQPVSFVDIRYTSLSILAANNLFLTVICRVSEQSVLVNPLPLGEVFLFAQHVSPHLRRHCKGTKQAHTCGSILRPSFIVGCLSCLQGMAFNLHGRALE
jgi:hypothetical protein